MTIHLNNLTYYTGDQLLYDQLNLSLTGNKIIWFIGANGVGKTTLFNLIMKKIKPDTGHVTVVGDIGYLPQELSFSNTVTIRGYLSNYIAGDREEYKIISVLDDLEMWDVELERLISDLSWGQQRKIAFAKLLLQECQILLLDEPTNHIDAATQEWLTIFLRQWNGMIILISHDRALLNEVCTTIVEIADQQAHVYDGNYDAYKIEKEHRYQNALADHTVRLKRKRKMEQRIADLKQRASVYDNPKRWRLIRSREKLFEREIINKPAEKPINEKKLTTSLAGGTHRGKFILSIERAPDGIQQLIREMYTLLPSSKEGSGEVGWVKLPWTKHIIELYGTDRLLISWPNGSGKSTLLKAIRQHISWSDVNAVTIRLASDLRICMIDQHLTELNQSAKVLDEFIAKAGAGYGDERLAKSVLQQFWLGEEHRRRRVKDLSYGQRVRLRFAQISTNTYDLLILDEPTNHLDIPTRETIEQALIDYEWALILVSHDQYFVEQMMITQMVELG